jgi:carbon monoxide dehydrogenase subunit G
MVEARVCGVLPLPPDSAWALLSDLARFDEWLTIHDAWESEIPELAAGATVTERLTVMGISSAIDWTIETFAPPSSLTIGGTGLAGAQIRFTLGLEPRDGSSLASINVQFTGALMVGAIGAAVEKNATAELETSLERLQRLAG